MTLALSGSLLVMLSAASPDCRALVERTATTEPDDAAGRRCFEALCRRIAVTTLDLDACSAETERLDDEAARRREARWAAGLTSLQRTRLRALLVAFEAFRKAEAERAYTRYLGGSARNLAAATQSSFVRQHHQRHLELVQGGRSFPAGDAQAFSSADRELNRAYRELPEEERGAAREAQRRWVKYRDAFEALASSLSTGPDAGTAAPLPLRTSLTRWRTLELERDPLSGEGGEAPPGDEPRPCGHPTALGNRSLSGAPTSLHVTLPSVLVEVSSRRARRPAHPGHRAAIRVTSILAAPPRDAAPAGPLRCRNLSPTDADTLIGGRRDLLASRLRADKREPP